MFSTTLFPQEIVDGCLEVNPNLWLHPPRENFTLQKQKFSNLAMFGRIFTGLSNWMLNRRQRGQYGAVTRRDGLLRLACIIKLAPTLERKPA